MQRFSSTSTTPSSVAKVAPTGQTWTQGGFAQWLQSFGTKKLLRTFFSFSGEDRSGTALTIAETSTEPSVRITYRSTQVRT